MPQTTIAGKPRLARVTARNPPRNAGSLPPERDGAGSDSARSTPATGGSGPPLRARRLQAAAGPSSPLNPATPVRVHCGKLPALPVARAAPASEPEEDSTIPVLLTAPAAVGIRDSSSFR